MTNDDVNTGRRNFLIGATSVVGGVGVAGVAVPFIGSWNPSAKAKAAGAPVKVDVSKLDKGAMLVAEWRGKPVYIVRRTEEQLAVLASNIENLADPDSIRPQQPEYISGTERAINPEYLIVIGLCTHLGCAPKHRPTVGVADLGADWMGGFFCPCHGSKFDLSGRVFKGVPAPSNLVVPPYRFDSESIVIIGEDSEVA